jgi:hypothetical protein
MFYVEHSYSYWWLQNVSGANDIKELWEIYKPENSRNALPMISRFLRCYLLLLLRVPEGTVLSWRFGRTAGSLRE